MQGVKAQVKARLLIGKLGGTQVKAYAPEVLILAPCSAGIGRGLSEACSLAAMPGWWGLPAVKSGRVYVVDHAYFSRPGPRCASPSLPMSVACASAPARELSFFLSFFLAFFISSYLILKNSQHPHSLPLVSFFNQAFRDVSSCARWWCCSLICSSGLVMCSALHNLPCDLCHVMLSVRERRLVEGVEMLARILHPDLVTKRCLDKTVLKLSLHSNQRCRQKLLANYFLPYA